MMTNDMMISLSGLYIWKNKMLGKYKCLKWLEYDGNFQRLKKGRWNRNLGK